MSLVLDIEYSPQHSNHYQMPEGRRMDRAVGYTVMDHIPAPRASCTGYPKYVSMEMWSDADRLKDEFGTIRGIRGVLADSRKYVKTGDPSRMVVDLSCFQQEMDAVECSDLEHAELLFPFANNTSEDVEFIFFYKGSIIVEDGDDIGKNIYGCTVRPGKTCHAALHWASVGLPHFDDTFTSANQLNATLLLNGAPFENIMLLEFTNPCSNKRFDAESGAVELGSGTLGLVHAALGKTDKQCEDGKVRWSNLRHEELQGFFQGNCIALKRERAAQKKKRKERKRRRKCGECGGIACATERDPIDCRTQGTSAGYAGKRRRGEGDPSASEGDSGSSSEESS